MAEVIRIAAAGDVHASEAIRERVESAFERVEDEADVILLAGALTTTGELEQAQVLADACRAVSIPVFAVLGNHDYHAGCATEIASLLTEAGVRVPVQDAVGAALGDRRRQAVAAEQHVDARGLSHHRRLDRGVVEQDDAQIAVHDLAQPVRDRLGLA